jgi:hypothetical protein
MPAGVLVAVWLQFTLCRWHFFWLQFESVALGRTALVAVFGHNRFYGRFLLAAGISCAHG